MVAQSSVLFAVCVSNCLDVLVASYLLFFPFKYVQGSTSKEADGVKETSRAERASIYAKRAAQASAAAALQQKRPTSSVEADITGGSSLSSQALPKQEVSTATSKNYTFKKGISVLCNNIRELALLFSSAVAF